MSDTLETLIAKQAITEVLHRYCYAVDRMDPELGAQIWHPDGLAHYGPDIYEGSGAGFIDWVYESHSHADATSHQVTNIMIEVDGDTATSETYVTACLRMGSTDIVARGRYQDTWSCRDGVWRIDVRGFETDLMQFLPVAALPAG